MFKIFLKCDRWTTYSYAIGAQRMSLVKTGKFHLTPSKTKKSLWVTDIRKRRVKLLSKEQTLEYARSAVFRWGERYAEQVLSATKTGSLYYNIIYHFRRFDNVIKEVNRTS